MTTLQRQYSLPNCTLTLEGLSEPGTTLSPEIRPVMSLLINAECQLPRQEKPLLGGREFFESLVTAVSLYAQEFLSGVHLPREAYSDRPSFVKLQRLDPNHHRIHVEKDPNNTMSDERVIDLTTVELFDLVEAVDQFVADTQTLPFWSLNLSPVSKRYVRSSEPLSKQVVPASIGVSGLAIAALAFFTLPAIKVNPPRCLTAGAPDCPTATVANSPSPGASPSISPTPNASVSPSASPSPDLAALEATLNTAPAITDPAALQTLKDRLSGQIRDRWRTQSAVTEPLEYRVGVAQNGDVVGYKPETSAALASVGQTPLSEILYKPVQGSTPSSEPIAQFKVRFKPQGQFDVAPIEATSQTPTTGSPAAIASAPTTEITDSATLDSLQPKLYDAIDKNWQGKPPFDQDLIYRVRLKADGSVLDFQPESSTAAASAKDTPLPRLGKQVDAIAPASEPTASFKVVLRPSGKLEVNPWYGVAR